MITMTKRGFKVLSVWIIVFLLCFSGCGSVSEKQTYANAVSGTVVLDAGHGGIDGGVTGTVTGAKESDLNLEIVKELAACFRAGGFKVILTRKGAGGLYGLPTKGFKRRDMQRRKEIANRSDADLFLSVHLNFYPSPSRRGAQVFYKENDDRSKAFADALQRSLNDSPDQPKEYSALKGDYYVLNECNCVCALAECGFLSNPEDEELLNRKSYREKIAYYLYRGSVDYLLSRQPDRN